MFLTSLFIYKAIYTTPRNWYNHYYYLSQSFLAGRVDVPNLPPFYHDTVTVNGKTYLPFPPTPALVLAPFILLFPNLTQQQISVLLGALTSPLLFFLLAKFTRTKNALVLTIFLNFGTVFFWASVAGTTWYFAHVVAVLLLLISLALHFSKKDFLSGIAFALAVLSRYPMAVGVIFFILQLLGKKKRLFYFLLGASAFIPIQIFYNWARFGSIFKMGYLEVYKNYADSTYPYTILQLVNPSIPLWGHMDPRNIPLHLFTFLIMPPIISAGKIIPSPYGMGILFTSPLLFLALKPPFKKGLEKNLAAGGFSIALVVFLHYMQGWVQFGYRFALDFLPFFLIILALRFRPKKTYFLLVAISIFVNLWGTYKAISFGW